MCRADRKKRACFVSDGCLEAQPQSTLSHCSFMPQVFRKDPCPCGSGRKYKRCCADKASPEQSLRADIKNSLSSHGMKNLLLDLATVAVFPENQQHEFRFLHLALMLLEAQLRSSGAGSELHTTINLCKLYDSMYRSIWSINEFDFKNIPYLSWFNVKGRGFKMLSGTLAEPELYFQETLHRVFPLDSIMQSELGFSFRTFLALFIQRGHDFLFEAGLSEFGQSSAGDWDPHISFGQLYLATSVRMSFEKFYVFQKENLNGEQSKLLEFLSGSNIHRTSDLNALMSGQSSLHTHPIVRLDHEYVVPFPQLLLPAICNRTWQALVDRKDATESYAETSRNRLVDMLVRKFGIECIIPMPPAVESRIADVVVLYDQKVLCFQIGVGDGGVQAALERSKQAQTTWDQYKMSGNLSVAGLYRTVTLPDLSDLEIIHLIVYAMQSDDAVGVPMEDTKSILEVFSFIQLQYLFDNVSSELDFLKFLRAKDRLKRSGELVIGGDTLDHYALYERTGTLLSSSNAQNLTGVIVDPMIFSAKYLEDLREFRRNHRIYGKEQRFLRQHYPGAWRGIDKHANYFFAFDFTNVTVTLQATSPGEEKSIYSAWHVSLEALSYHLGTRRNEIEQRLQQTFPEVRAVELTVNIARQDEPAIFERLESGEKVRIGISLSSAIAALFMRGNNDGESLLINGLLKCLGVLSDDEADTLYLASSTVRRTQLFPYQIPHKSFAEPIQAIKIYEADRRLVERLEAQALSAAKIAPGNWNAIDEIMDILSIVLGALHIEFEKRIVSIAYEELVQLSYRQLEASYIESEHSKVQLAIGAHTAEFVDVEQKYLETSRAAVELTFAIRLILETALRLSSVSKRHVTEENYSELLAFARRLVELDFEGDMIWMFVPNKLNLISLRLDKSGILQINGAKDLANPVGGHLFQVHTSKLATPNETNDQAKSETHFRGDFFKSFNDPFKEVYGHTLADRIEVTNALLQTFDEKDSPVLFENKAMIADDLCKISQKAPDMVQTILDQLTLTQKNLSELKAISPSTGYWRGARILNRPIIELGEKILVTRMVLDLSLQIFVRRLAAGRYKPEVKNASRLTNEIGRWRNLAGEHFRTSMVDLFRTHGFLAFPEVESLNSVAIPREGISGVDIVAIEKSSHLVLIVECKNIEMAKSPTDLKNEVFNFFLNDKEPGYVQRTRNKWKWVNENRHHLLAEYKLDAAENWHVEPLLVTSDYLWSQLLVEQEVPIRSEHELIGWLAERECKE